MVPPALIFGLEGNLFNPTFPGDVNVSPLSDHTGSVGIIYMDFAGMDMSPNYTGKEIYETAGMKLVDSVIKQNWK